MSTDTRPEPAPATEPYLEPAPDPRRAEGDGLVAASFTTLPWSAPLSPRSPAARVVPEPPRRGEPGGAECGVCTGRAAAPVWGDEHWTLHPPVRSSLPGTVWLASRRHVDSFLDLPAEVAATFGAVVARIERAILSRHDVGRVHLYRWGDGGAHFHVWLMPRPLGLLDAAGPLLPLWEDVLPNVPDAELRAAAEQIGAAMDAS